MRQPPPPSAVAVVDAELITHINHEWKRAGIVNYTHIVVRSTGGEVSLSGELPDEASIERAIEVARSIQGVRSVTSDLRVGSRP